MVYYTGRQEKAQSKLRKALQNLGVAQLGARYLGVVEAAGSSPVTQIENGNRMVPVFILYTGGIPFFPLHKALAAEL